MQMGGRAPELSLEQREKRRFAKRIIKAIQPALEEAIRNESELNRKPFEKELKELDVLLEESVQSHRDSPELDEVDHFVTPVESNGIGHKIEDGEEEDAIAEPEEGLAAASIQKTDPTIPDADVDQAGEPSEQRDDAAAVAPEPGVQTRQADGGYEKKERDSPKPRTQAPGPQNGPMTPPLMSFQGDQQLPLAQGGIQWYMQPFDPVGTTVYEERWTGRDVMRGMSEELSELDEDELEELVDDEVEAEQPAAGAAAAAAADEAVVEQPVKVHRTRRRWRGFK